MATQYRERQNAARNYGYNRNSGATAKSIPQRSPMPSKQPKQENAKRKPEKRPRPIASNKLKMFLKVIFVSTVAFLVLTRFTVVSLANLEAIQIEKAINDQIAKNAVLEVELDRSKNILNVQNIARDEYEMASPTNKQLIYVSLRSYEEIAEENKEKNRQMQEANGENTNNSATRTIDIKRGIKSGNEEDTNFNLTN